MYLLDKIKSSLSPDNHHYQQSSAIVDLMYLIMLSDRRLDLNEQDYIAEQLLELPWDPNQSISLYIQAMVPKLRNALSSPETLHEQIVSICDRIHDRPIREQVLHYIHDLSEVDGYISSEERQIIEEVEHELQLV
ncbi:MAG: hypothetical protein VKJ24_04355 [Synechococcales bacterium]|nr:hypothetical protein [Synechococcales bacterium]